MQATAAYARSFAPSDIGVSLNIAMHEAEQDGNPARPSPSFASLFVRDVIATELRSAGSVALLYPSEAAHCARFAAGRSAEYAAGRLCARRGLAALGITNVPIATKPDRSPVWPAGVCGSITHTRGYAAAAVARTHAIRSVGIDAERIGRLTPEMHALIFTESEAQMLATAPAAAGCEAQTIVFSAKEAYYKCQYPVTGAWRDFHDVEVELRPDSYGTSRGTFVIRPSAVTEITAWGIELPLFGRYVCEDELVLTAVAIKR